MPLAAKTGSVSIKRPAERSVSQPVERDPKRRATSARGRSITTSAPRGRIAVRSQGTSKPVATQYSKLEAAHTKLQKESEKIALDVAMTEQKQLNEIFTLQHQKQQLEEQMEEEKQKFIEFQELAAEDQRQQESRYVAQLNEKDAKLYEFRKSANEKEELLKGNVEKQEKLFAEAESKHSISICSIEEKLNNLYAESKQTESTLTQSIKDKDEEIKLLHDQIQEQLVQIKSFEVLNEEQKANISDAAAEYQSLSNEMNVAQQRVKELELTLTEKERYTDSLKLELTTKTSDANALRNELTGQHEHVITLKSRVETLEKLTQDMTSRLGATQGNLCELSERERQKELLILQGEQARRKLLVQIEELKGNIRVYCRVRPPLGSKFEAPLEYPDKIDNRMIEIRQSRDNATSTARIEKPIQFKYDAVFSPQCSQDEIFERVSPVVESAVDGFKVCIFAYGQTGSGKTYTMEGTPEKPGIIMRSVERIFDSTQQLIANFGWNFNLSCTFVEIYNDIIRDLLVDSEDYQKAILDRGEIKHEIRHDGKQDTNVTGVRVVSVTAPYELEELLRTAMQNRTTARTKINERSSRSHSVFTLKIEGTNQKMGQKTSGILCLIDLAGSERVSESGVQGHHFKEAVQINRSLSHLGDVILALGQREKALHENADCNAPSHVPYRNSKLTYLLQNYLGGEGSKVLMLVNVSPLEEHASETVSSLRFASKVNATNIGVAKKRTSSN